VISPVNVSLCSQAAVGGEPGTSRRVLILAPSRGLGGGIERYVETLEWAFAAQEISCQRVDLTEPGAHGHVQMLAAGRTLLRKDPRPTRLVVSHRSLLPAAMLIAREPTVCGLSVLCHGVEGWDTRLWPRRSIERALMRRPDVRVIAVSSFTAGTLAGNCKATILPPALSLKWFEALAGAATAVRASAGIQLATVFRLADWREKGLPELIEAVASLDRHDIRLVICGSGEPSVDLLRLVRNRSWCTLIPGVTDSELAHLLAAADLFVLATRTRLGRHAFGEGFGLVLLEAQIAGTPVIVPAHGGSSDAYVEGVTGAAPVDETTEALASVLLETLEDPARLAWMGRRAAVWARESFAPERYARLVTRRLL
jgi:phosphatidylinositol alpha-1,6-mannosyltransferase